MGDDSLIPISDEQAKLGQELVKAVRDGSGYFTDILGDLPKDLIGYLIGDRVKAKRIERQAALWHRTRERLQDRGVDPEPPSLKYAIPILEAAADEENDELQDLWSRLLAAAMDPKRRDAMRQSFIQTVKEMDPMDAASPEGDPRKRGRQVGAQWARCNSDPSRLLPRRGHRLFPALGQTRLHFLYRQHGPACSSPTLKPFGNLLMNVVSG